MISCRTGLVCCGVPLIGLLAVRMIYRLKIARYNSEHQLQGKTILITGATSGIGFYSALDLAQRNPKMVIITGRDEKKGQSACCQLRELSGNQNIHYFPVDLSELSNVREFAGRVGLEYPVIDVLINNAGCSYPSAEITADGFNRTMASNYFAPILLTDCLLPNLRASDQGRIINVASVGYKFGKIDIDDLNLKSNDSPFMAYVTSKLGNVLFTRHLARVLHQEGSRITVNSLHPGFVNTDLFRDAPFLGRKFWTFLTAYLFKSSEEGAQTTIFCAVEPDLCMVSGVYFEDCTANFNLEPIGRDDELARELWTKTRVLCGIDKTSQ